LSIECADVIQLGFTCRQVEEKETPGAQKNAPSRAANAPSRQRAQPQQPREAPRQRRKNAQRDPGAL
jgi:hypothetical protein